MIIKPAEDTPLSALALAELADRAGFPAGVFNVLPTNDAKAVGDVLCASEVVRKLSFTGSTAVGKILFAKAANTIKKMSLELGGNAPFIVFDDADIDAAVDGAILCKFRNSGQTCVCANRFYIHDDVFEQFSHKFIAKVKQVDVGPLINQAGLAKVKRLVDETIAAGATVLAGGEMVDGNFFAPTVLSNLQR